MRISVELTLSLMAQGQTMKAILEDYPELEPDDIRACLAYARAAIADESIEAVRGQFCLRLLVDRCAGRKLADWLSEQEHDVLEVRTLGRDPGDAALLRQAADEGRILVTIDTDFGTLIHLRAQPHAGLVRLPDAPPAMRIELMTQIPTCSGRSTRGPACATEESA